MHHQEVFQLYVGWQPSTLSIVWVTTKLLLRLVGVLLSGGGTNVLGAMRACNRSTTGTKRRLRMVKLSRFKAVEPETKRNETAVARNELSRASCGRRLSHCPNAHGAVGMVSIIGR
jgi:hypothetical protein